MKEKNIVVSRTLVAVSRRDDGVDGSVHDEDLSTMSVVAEVPSMEMEEMDGRCAGGMSPRSWNSAACQELAQPRRRRRPA